LPAWADREGVLGLLALQYDRGGVAFWQERLQMKGKPLAIEEAGKYLDDDL